MKKINLAGMALLILGMLAGCGGGGSTPAASTPSLSGVAAVGSPIIGGAINVRCAAGSALAPVSTGSTGAWQIGISGQTLPCAVQVSGGTINGAANATPYHSISTAAGTVNVTPLTDLMVANLAGTATPDVWFNGLGATPAPLTTITQTNVDGSLAKLRAALSGLTPMSTINPVTTAFAPAPGNISDDMLAALATAMTGSGTTYATLLGNASASGFTAPAAAFGTALTNAYSGTTSGGASAIPAVPSGVSATASSASQINVNWTNVSGATGYNIYRSTSPNVQIVSGNKITPSIAMPTAGPFPNTGLAASTTYYYKVTAVNAAGESAGSSEVSATTQAAAVVAAIPTVTGFSPNSGATGTTVTITGTNLGNFTPAAVVKFGTTTATVTSANTTTIVVSAPASLATGNSTITLSNFDGTGAVTVGVFNVTAAGATIVGTQMGGAMQGVQLNLSNMVTRLLVSGTSFKEPGGIATDGTTLYVADTLNNLIQKIDIASNAGVIVAGSVMAGSTDGASSIARFKAPGGITTDGTNIFVADTGNHRIRKIVIATGDVSTLAGSVLGFADGLGTAALFNYPRGITTDGVNLYVADSGNFKIRKIVIASGVVTTVAGSANGFADGIGTAAMFSYSSGITTDGSNLYVADMINQRIRKIIIATGEVTTVAGSGAMGAANGLGTAASFRDPKGITTDGSNLYVSEYGNHKVRKIVISTGNVTTVVGTGSPYADASGAAYLNYPEGITTDGNNIFVLEPLASQVARIQ